MKVTFTLAAGFKKNPFKAPAQVPAMKFNNEDGASNCNDFNCTEKISSKGKYKPEDSAR